MADKRFKKLDVKLFSKRLLNIGRPIRLLNIGKPILSIIAISLAISVSAPFIYGFLASSPVIPTSGVIASANLGVYSNKSCTNNLTAINWGFLYPNSTYDLIIYVKNIGNLNMTIQMDTINWNPSIASTYIALDWNYQGQSLIPNDVVTIKLTLTVYPDAADITNFAFDILFTGTG